MNTILDEWEAEAKEDLKEGIGFDGDKKRILALIDLIRKKDEALKFYADDGYIQGRMYGHLAKRTQEDLIRPKGYRAREALALTEQLK